MVDITRITFVWNADFSLASGVRALKEAVEGHHSCTLCEIAYHRVTQTGEWKAYKEELKVSLKADVREPCKNQLTQEEIHAAAGDFPAVLAHTNDGVIKLLGSKEVNSCLGEFSVLRSKLNKAIAIVV
ncbi:MAG: hypothetical protein KUG73_04365 [Pseudomonadales bacterium]|nr:hypothetical protein [Pseudomonadales bacterium]